MPTHIEMHEPGADKVAYDKGYEDAFESNPLRDVEGCQYCYSMGFIAGTHDREEVDRDQSSNT